MKKTFSILMTLALLIASVAAASAALGDDAVTSNTSWTFQNLGSAAAEVGVKLYDTTGAMQAEDSFTVDKSASFYAPNYTPLGSEPFNGALVANSSQPLASIANQVAANGTSGKTGQATYMGFTADSVAPTMYAPVVMKSFAGYYTELSIQSAGGDVAVTVTYYNQSDGSVAATSKYNVKAGSPLRVAQADEAGLPDEFNGGVKIAADDGTTPLAVVVNEFVGIGGGMYNQFYSYEGFAAGSQKVVLPAVFINGYGGGYQASTSIQNLGSADANVTWHFYDTTGGNPNAATEIYSQTTVIPTSVSVYFPAENYAQTLMDAYSAGDNEWIGTVVLESDQPLIAIVNELAGGYWAASYTGFSDGVTELYFPLAFVNGYGFAQTSFSIADMSTEGGDVSVTVDYIADTAACAGCTDDQATYTFQNTDSKYQPDHIAASSLSEGAFIGSIKITSDKPINGIMNEIVGSFDMDSFTSFNAFYTAVGK